MLVVDGIEKELGGRRVLGRVSFAVSPGAPLGVVGPNGSGKSTLLRILRGELGPDAGRVSMLDSARVGYLSQGYAGHQAEPVSAAFLRAFAADLAADRLSTLADAIAAAAPSDVAVLAREYDSLLEHIAAGSAGLDLDEARGALRVRDIRPETPVGQLSGGELTKLGLLDLVASAPDVLLLDEPTNHLGLTGLEWVETAIHRFPGVVVVVSHDRVFLDRCAGQVLELDADGKWELFSGNYGALLAEKQRRAEDQLDRYERQQREQAQLKQAIHKIETRARGIENRTIDFAKRKKALKIARRATTLKARISRQLESADHVERPAKRMSGFHGEFAAPDAGASRLLTAEAVALDIAGRRLFEKLNFQLRRGECVIVTGPNGCGKTTLLRAILGHHPVAAGTLGVSGSASIGYLAQHDDPADSAGATATPIELLRRATPMTEAAANNYLHQFFLGREQLSTPVSQLSYGERRRLALALLVRGGANLLLLDEPTNHLDLPSREAFETAFEGYGGASVVVTHDRRFIERFADAVIEL
jgi:ATP-binding cassette subfamily F protein 3